MEVVILLFLGCHLVREDWTRVTCFVCFPRRKITALYRITSVCRNSPFGSWRIVGKLWKSLIAWQKKTCSKLRNSSSVSTTQPEREQLPPPKVPQHLWQLSRDLATLDNFTSTVGCHFLQLGLTGCIYLRLFERICIMYIQFYRILYIYIIYIFILCIRCGGTRLPLEVLEVSLGHGVPRNIPSKPSNQKAQLLRTRSIWFLVLTTEPSSLASSSCLGQLFAPFFCFLFVFLMLAGYWHYL